MYLCEVEIAEINVGNKKHFEPGHNTLDYTQDYWGNIRSNSLDIGCVQKELNYYIRSTNISKHKTLKNLSLTNLIKGLLSKTEYTYYLSKLLSKVCFEHSSEDRLLNLSPF